MASILLIDDSPDFRALVRLLLEQGDHRIIEAESGEEGLRLAAERLPDLILTDLAMPGLSGWDVVRRARREPELAAIPIVALTAHAMRGDRERALASGCDGFIPKPIDDESFEATVRSFLPADRAPSPKGIAPASIAESSAGGGGGPLTPGRRILVVDDNPDVLALTSQYLTSAGFTTLAASDGPTALATVEREGPELVLLDVILPGMDGYQVTSRLKARPGTAFLPVVLVTAGILDRERGLSAGADDFLRKPVDRIELLARVRSLLRLREAIEEGRRQAEALRRLDRTKQRFIATVAHDLRTPLNAMAVTIEMVRLVRPAQEELDESLGVLARNIRQMSDLLNGLLDYSQLVAGEQPLSFAPFDPRDLVADVRESLLATAALKGIDLRAEFREGLLSGVVSDYAKCRQVIFNLASNALKFTQNGFVELRTRADGAGRWAVDVADSGVGIAQDDLETIFEEFGQARTGRPPGTPGTGLGLAISRHLVERLGGALSVASQPGQGSVFTATWPVHPPRDHQSQPTLSR